MGFQIEWNEEVLGGRNISGSKTYLEEDTELQFWYRILSLTKLIMNNTHSSPENKYPEFF